MNIILLIFEFSAYFPHWESSHKDPSPLRFNLYSPIFFSHMMMMMLGNSLIHLKCDPVSGIIRLGSHKIPSEVTPIVSPSLFIFIRKRCLMMNNPTRTISSHSASSVEFLTFSWAQSLKDQGLYLLWDGMKIDVTFYDLMIFPYSLYAAPSLTPRAD